MFLPGSALRSVRTRVRVAWNEARLTRAHSPAMRRITLVRGARQLLTLRGPDGPRRGAELRNLGLIQDGAVLVVDGLIHEVGPSRRLENLALARSAQEIDASGRVVMPGFVDSHMHLVGGPARML